MATTIQLKRGLEADIEAANPVLAQGEPVFATDTGILKIGDGTTAYNNLAGISGAGGLDTWESGITYTATDIVLRNGVLYYSTSDANQGNDPATDDGTWWTGFLLQSDFESFTATLSVAHTTTAGMVFDQVLATRGSGYDNTTGEFTAPRDGTYLFAFGGIAYTSNTLARMKLQIDDGSGFTDFGPNHAYEISARTDAVSDYDHASVTLAATLSAGDKVRLYCIAGGWNENYTWFSGTEIPSGVKGEKGDAGIAHPYDSLVSYPVGAVVTQGSLLYVSQQSSNTGNDPSSDDGTWWRQTSLDVADPVVDRQIDTTTSGSFDGSFATFREWDPVALPAGAKILYTVHIPHRNDDAAWGGGYFKLDYRIDSGAWQTVGHSGYDLSMVTGGDQIGHYSQTFFFDFSSRTAAFTIEFRWQFRSYQGTLKINDSGSNKIDTYATPNAEDGAYQFWANQIIAQVGGVKGEKGDAGIGASWDSGTTYLSNSVVSYGSALYQSLQTNNVGNTPSTSPDWWVEVVFEKLSHFDSGWIQKSSFRGLDEDVAHGLNTDLSNLIWTMSFSSDGTDSNAVTHASRDYTGSGISYGWSLHQKNSNTVTLAVTEGGIQFTPVGTTDNFQIQEQGYYYRFQAWVVPEYGLKGEQGEPGAGISWDSTTTFPATAIVQHNGVRYEALQSSTDVEPGVDTGWETYWRLAPYTKVVWTDTEPDVGDMEEGTLYLVY